ncbi:hypothetical protein M8A51_01820 [Schlegelella sp. S2-27]|uniref:Flagellar assembly protein FliH/Type III secretion system HrpE domain-containing protein n=1 Tax=Caldimonas mangrovi TaxID=2944811 RepID=A0ABT0YHP8_9BURK|nr:hypothetical protein [Caldimonas mangrovi]MCM5678261.1 hypothetical protein [Caldimonas mangrovi]
MNYLLWTGGRDLRVVSRRQVVPAHEVPLLDDAQALVASLRRAQHAQALEVEEAAREAARQAETRANQAAAAAARESLAEHLVALAGRLRDEQEAARRLAVRLAVQIVRKIAATVGPADTVAALAETAARSLQPDEPCVLHLHPSLAESVGERLQRWSFQAPGARPLLEVMADEDCGPFDCRLVTALGSRNAGLEVQLTLIENALNLAGDPHDEPA